MRLFSVADPMSWFDLRKSRIRSPSYQVPREFGYGTQSVLALKGSVLVAIISRVLLVCTQLVLRLVESHLLESTISSTDVGAKKTPEIPYHLIREMIRIGHRTAAKKKYSYIAVI